MELKLIIILTVSINLSLCNRVIESIFVRYGLVCDITEDLLIKPTFSCVKCNKRNIPDCYSNGYNETHVWFPFKALELQCVATTKNVLNTASCHTFHLPPGNIAVIPPKCGLDIYGKPITCGTDFNK
nr:uncharacterized protein LOC111423813 [Onthophagus taurus]